MKLTLTTIATLSAGIAVIAIIAAITGVWSTLPMGIALATLAVLVTWIGWQEFDRNYDTKLDAAFPKPCAACDYTDNGYCDHECHNPVMSEPRPVWDTDIMGSIE